MAAAGSVALQLAEDAADGLAQIEDRAEKDSNLILKAALARVLLELRRSFSRYREATTTPGSVSPAELTARYQDVIRSAQRFLSDGELARWEATYRRHLEAAMEATAKAAEQQAKAADPDQAMPPFRGPDPVVVDAQLQAASASVRQESAGFREQLVVIAAMAAAQGWGSRRVELEARRALEGVTAAGRPAGGRPVGGGRGPGATGGPAPAAAPTPQAPGRRQPPRRQQTGTLQRIAVNVRTGLQNAAARLTTQIAQVAGYDYARWVATRDERTCNYCASRHGQIYPIDQIGIPAHRRCRCQAQFLRGDDVNNPDPAEREQALDAPFWRRSQRQVWREYAKSKGKTLEQVQGELRRAQATPTANERWRTPGTTRTTRPALTLDGPGGQDLTQAVQDANRQQ